MNNLWRPEKKDRTGINRGNVKQRISDQKILGIIRHGRCRFCGVNGYEKRDRFLTLGGSDHKCKNMIDAGHAVG